MIRCMQCMEEYDERLDRCPHCHQQPQAPEPFQLPYGTMLDDRFLIGAMLGHGGFGITYIGWDTLLDQKVAIKEYLPMNLATLPIYRFRQISPGLQRCPLCCQNPVFLLDISCSLQK